MISKLLYTNYLTR